MKRCSDPIITKCENQCHNAGLVCTSVAHINFSIWGHCVGVECVDIHVLHDSMYVFIENIHFSNCIPLAE